MLGRARRVRHDTGSNGAGWGERFIHNGLAGAVPESDNGPESAGGWKLDSGLFFLNHEIVLGIAFAVRPIAGEEG